MHRTLVVLDTNTIISSLMFPKSKVALIWRGWQREAFDLVMSDPLYTEVKRKLEEFRKKGHPPKAKVRRALRAIRKTAIFVEVKEIPKVTRDPTDDMVIATAIAARADFLITGDKDILALGKSYKKVRILKPADFLT